MKPGVRLHAAGVRADRDRASTSGSIFHRDRTLQIGVDSAVDLAHPAGADLDGDFVGADPGAGTRAPSCSFYAGIAWFAVVGRLP